MKRTSWRTNDPHANPSTNQSTNQSTYPGNPGGAWNKSGCFFT